MQWFREVRRAIANDAGDGVWRFFDAPERQPMDVVEGSGGAALITAAGMPDYSITGSVEAAEAVAEGWSVAGPLVDVLRAIVSREGGA